VKFQELDSFYGWVDTQLTGVKTGTLAVGHMAEVMTSADFQYALGEFLQRRMEPAYKRKRFNFEPIVKMDTAPNYSAVTRYQDRAGVDDLEYVGEKGEASPGSRDDAIKKQWQVYKWQKQYEFSMEALVNDDLAYFSDQARLMAEAARRTLEKYVSRFMWNATTTGRLTALLAMYSTTGRLTTARISAARMAFNQRVDARGEPILASLKYIVHHSGLVDTVATIQNSTLVPELATNAVNVVRGTFTPIEDPFCAGTAPNLPWFALTDYAADNIVPFILGRRAGMPGAVIARKTPNMEIVGTMLGAGTPAPPLWGDFETGNIVLKVMDEWGTFISGTDGNMYDVNGCYYSSGTAP